MASIGNTGSMKNFMKKEDVIKRFCAMATAVGMTVFEDKEAHDCFCGENNQFNGRYFQFSETVLEWIESAIKNAIWQHNNALAGDAAQPSPNSAQ